MRPQIYGERMVKKSLNAPKRDWDWLRKWGGDNLSNALRALIAEKRNEEGGKE